MVAKNKSIQVKRLMGEDLARALGALADLRIQVFREYPYLYEGSIEYEKKYLDVYLRSSRSAIIAAYDGLQIIGAATALPLEDENDNVKAPFIKAHFDLSRIFYFGESVLLKEYRGLGLGHRFFDAREEAAKSYGSFNITCFCAVQRPENHPMKPPDYRPLNRFWEKRGYRLRGDLQSEFSWRDIGEKEETSKKMTYWMKEWTPADITAASRK